jgi:hypothetical protein
MIVVFPLETGQPIGLTPYVHLGHTINCQLDDSDDIRYRRNCLIGQSTNALYYFNKLALLVRTKLFQNFCNSMYGCELWSSADRIIEEFCVAWRKSLRRVLNLPYDSHGYLLSLLSGTVPVFIEICKRSARFTSSSLNNRSILVQSFPRHGINFARHKTCVGRNALFCCNYFIWNLPDFSTGNVLLRNYSFTNFF